MGGNSRMEVISAHPGIAPSGPKLLCFTSSRRGDPMIYPFFFSLGSTQRQKFTATPRYLSSLSPFLSFFSIGLLLGMEPANQTKRETVRRYLHPADRFSFVVHTLQGNNAVPFIGTGSII
ncbi:hypothetical protein VTH06DRAFT_2864 [Thermothelomyces fergusii]